MYHTNKMFIISEMKTSDIIIANPYLLLMLEHLEINEELREKTINKICNENNISIELFLAIANLFNGFKPSSETEYSFNDIKTIISYLENSHQYYIKEKYPKIKEYIKIIYKINNHAEILMIEKFFNKYFIEVTEHLNYENKLVFPYVRNLYKHFNQSKSNINTDKYSVVDYREHHNDIEEKLNDLKNLLIKYLPHNNDQQVRRELLFCLFELEYDLNIHSQIEDLIFIPLVEKMELQLKNNNE